MRSARFLLALLLLPGCALFSTTEDAPSWAHSPPRQSDAHFFVGESHGSRDKDEALERAWISALTRVGMTQFPELVQVSTRSTENLASADTEREFTLRLEQVDWSGVREAGDKGSPWILRRDDGTFTVYRLLKWPNGLMDAARKRLLRAEKRPMDRMLRQLKIVNERVDKRDRALKRIFDQVRCGVKVSDLTTILGSPDSVNPYNPMRVEKEYFWGSYRVARVGDNPFVAVIGRRDARPNLVCPGAGAERFLEE